MKHNALIAIVLCAGVTITSLGVHAASAGTCAAKEQNIQQQLEQARRHHNTSQVRGLENALKSVQTHCNDADLHAQRQSAVAEMKSKVTEREHALRESVQSGADADKIQKRRDKLTEAQKALADAERALQISPHP